MAVRADWIMWELSLTWFKGMTPEESTEAKALLTEIVDRWIERVKDLPPPLTPEKSIQYSMSDLNKHREEPPSERLAFLRLEVFSNRMNRTTYRAYETARRILDGEVARESVSDEGRRLMDEISELRKEAAVIDPDNKTGAEMQLSEAFLEANFIWRGGGMSMRLGNYARTKSGR